MKSRKTIVTLNCVTGDTPIHSGEYNPTSGLGLDLIPQMLEKVPEAEVGETHKAVILINRELTGPRPLSLSLRLLVKVVCFGGAASEYPGVPGLYLVEYFHYPRSGGEDTKTPGIKVNKLNQENVSSYGTDPTSINKNIRLS